MTMLYFLTPILFDMKTVAKSRPDIIPLLKCNPLTPLMEGYRQLFLDGVFCADLFGLSLAYGLAALAIGWAVYTRLRWRFAEVA
jgi:lipopolysaccharide transport system permease protein